MSETIEVPVGLLKRVIDGLDLAEWRSIFGYYIVVQKCTVCGRERYDHRT
jgi:hypothetical protein